MGDGQLIAFVGVGLVVGLAFFKFVQGHGAGIISSLFVGVAGAIIVGSLIAHMGISLGTGHLAPALHGTIGAVLLLSLWRVLRM